MKIRDKKEIFWKSDANVTAYYITFEEMEQIAAKSIFIVIEV